jgi:hypothetical protein
MASIAFLLVMLGMTFASAIAARLPPDGRILSSILAQQTPLSFAFFSGLRCCLKPLVSGDGFAHVRWGIATAVMVALGLVWRHSWS